MRYVFIVSLMFISVFSFSPGEYTPAFIVNHDKMAHASVFFILSFFLHRAFPVYKIQTIVLFGLSFGLAIETVQYFFASRGFSLEDLIFDSIGVAIYVSAYLSLKKIISILHNTQKEC